MISHNKKINIISLFFLYVIGCSIAYYRASNFSDGDAYSVILAFLNYFNEGIYTPSRGAYGHPVPELLIGFFSYHFGTSISNILCFSLFYFSLFFLYQSFFPHGKKINLFIFLVLSNSYLLFENTNSIDYPITFFFLSVAIFLLKRKKHFFSYIFFGITIASRANFLTIVYPILLIFFYNEYINKKFINIIKALLIVTFVGLFFYIPLFELHNYSIDFLDLPFLTESNDSLGWYGGPQLTLNSLVPRFVYKVYLLTGIYSSIFLLIFLFFILKKIDFFNKDNVILFTVIFINLFVFFFMPTKLLIINPFIICLYILFFKYLDNKKILILIFFNFLQWFITYHIVDITYKEKEICSAIEATNYEFNFSIHEGKLIEYIYNKDDMTKCYSGAMGKYSENFKNGKPLKLAD